MNRTPTRTLQSLLFVALSAVFCISASASERIVSAGGSVTEVLFALGLKEQVVAVDTSSLYPLAATQKPKVGYYRQLSPEGVLSMNPTVVVGHRAMGPESVLEQIKSAGVDVMHIQESTSVEGIFALITTLAKRFGKESEGKALVQRINDELRGQPKLTGDAVKAAFFVSLGERGIVAAGTSTMPAGVMASVGVSNLFGDLEGYKPVSAEALLVGNPDFILVPQHVVPEQGVASLCETPAAKLWVAQRGCRIYAVDSLTFMGLSPRVAQAHSHLYRLSQQALQGTIIAP